MRTTLTIDDDVVVLLRKAVARERARTLVRRSVKVTASAWGCSS